MKHVNFNLCTQTNIQTLIPSLKIKFHITKKQNIFEYVTIPKGKLPKITILKRKCSYLINNTAQQKAS